MFREGSSCSFRDHFKYSAVWSDAQWTIQFPFCQRWKKKHPNFSTVSTEYCSALHRLSRLSTSIRYLFSSQCDTVFCYVRWGVEVRSRCTVHIACRWRQNDKLFFFFFHQNEFLFSFLCQKKSGGFHFVAEPSFHWFNIMAFGWTDVNANMSHQNTILIFRLFFSSSDFRSLWCSLSLSLPLSLLKTQMHSFFMFTTIVAGTVYTIFT